MNSAPRFLSRQLARCLPDAWILKRPVPCFLPFYHAVSQEKLPYILNYPYRDISQFEKELDYYLKFFRPVTLEELISGECAGKKIFHLSFDDGLRQCAEVIAPILLRKGIPATFFINTAFAGNKRLFYRYKASLILSTLQKKTNPEAEQFLESENLAGENILTASVFQENILDQAAGLLGISFSEFLERENPYMTPDNIIELASEGFTIGSHSHTHPEFWKIPEEEQLSEIQTSMEWVNQLVNPAIKAFSFPFTDAGVPASVLTRIKNEGICDVTFGTAGIKYDAFEHHYQRYPVEQPGDFIDNLKGEIIYFELRKWAGKAKVKH